MSEHVHEWMVSSVGGVFLAICNALDSEGSATCEAELTDNEIDTRLNEYETLKKATERLSAEDARKLADTIEFIAPHVILDFDTGSKHKLKHGYLSAEQLRAYADTLEGLD